MLNPTFKFHLTEIICFILLVLKKYIALQQLNILASNVLIID